MDNFEEWGSLSSLTWDWWPGCSSAACPTAGARGCSPSAPGPGNHCSHNNQSGWILKRWKYVIRESKQPPGCISSLQTQFQCLAVKLYFFALGLPMTISVCKWAADVSWPMNNWGQFANVKLISVCQWSADISLPMSCWCYVGQWAAGISWPINSWCKLANM